MSINKTIHIREKYDYKEGAEIFPLMVVLSFVYICNADCPNCPYNNSQIRKTYKNALTMSENIFKKIADECGYYNSYLRISGGGEPMLHPKAVELMEYAKQKGAKVGLITNGSLFDEDKLKRLFKAGIENIEFSVDACDEEVYKKVRPKLNWEKLNKNVRLAVDIRNKLKSNTRIIASAINQVGIDANAVEKYWEKIVDKVQIRKYLTWGYNKNESADSRPYLPLEERVPCPWLFERFNIDSRGEATICGEDISFSEKFGSILDSSIKDLWHHYKMEYFRKKHLERKGNEIGICSRCSDWQYRSWNYNYWKVVNDAEKKRSSLLGTNLNE